MNSLSGSSTPSAHRILLTGAGAHGFNTYVQRELPLLEEAGRIHLAGVVDPSSSARDRVRESRPKIPLFEKLADAITATSPDALIVCSPYVQHEEDCCLAASHGIDLFIEKPVCGDMAAVLRVVKAVEEAGVKAAVNMSARFETEKLAFQRALKEGVAGRVEYIYARSIFNHEANARFRAHTPHPFLMEAGVHFLDLVRCCAGGHPKTVFNLAWPSPASVFAGNASCVVSFEMDNGVRCVHEGSWSSRADLAHWRDEYIRADGDAGSLLLDHRKMSLIQGLQGDPGGVKSTEIHYEKNGPSGTATLFNAFLDWREGKREEHPTEIHANTDCMALLFAANLSADTRAAIDLKTFLSQIEGGPLHVRDHGSEYMKRLRTTGREELAEKFEGREQPYQSPELRE